MAIFTRFFRTLAAGAFAALALATPLRANTVTNVADARWNIGAQTYSIQSNAVRFDVAISSTKLETLTPLPGADRTVQLASSYCGNRAAARGFTVPALSAVPVIASNTITAGRRLILRVLSVPGNVDSGAADTLQIELTTPEGDREVLVAQETGPDTAEFIAAIDTDVIGGVLAVSDCMLTIAGNEQFTVQVLSATDQTVLATSAIRTLADPSGIVFDSLDGSPVNGARVTLVNSRTGAPASVFAPDGVTPYPSTIISGQDPVDSAGHVYDLDDGQYLFPLAPLGEYRLLVEPPAPYTVPSQIAPEALAGLTRPGGGPFEITPASYGAVFRLETLDPVRIDIPVDAPAGLLALAKTASREVAQAGDGVRFQLQLQNRDVSRATRPVVIDDLAPAGLRLAPGSLRIDGQSPAPGIVQNRADGRGFSLHLPALAPRGTQVISYGMTVRPDAAPGIVVNRAVASSDGNSVTAEAKLRITRDALADRVTIIGRITDGSCADPRKAHGIPGVRVLLEDGSFAVTDADGRYHFEGIFPGNHVVQAAKATLPEGGRFVDCRPSTSTVGRANSRFVTGRGGSLLRADFTARLPEGALVARPLEEAPAAAASAASDSAANGNVDWLKLGDGPAGFIAPLPDANPRSPAIRVAVRHQIGQTVSLTVDGTAADPLSFEGMVKDPQGRFAVSHWRGIALKNDATMLHATIRDAAGTVLETYDNQVNFADTPMRAVLVPERSHLVADGTSRPVVAVRFLDRHGRPVHGGISGQFTLDGPYESAAALAARQDRALTGFGSAAATWVVDGDEGVALIELAPTMVSGGFRVRFDFSDGEAKHSEELESWMVPGEQPWTLIGLAEGSIGARSVADNMERAADFDSDLGDHARMAFYAKGRVLGKYLLTMAYDSAKQKSEQQLLGAIDPQAYYTVFADGSQRLYDAPSREKLYVRVERGLFYALYGDFQTGFDQTVLARYQRTMTGVKAEGRLGKVQAQAFAAKVGSRFHRDEIQGAGVTGPYYLSSRYFVPNSETIALEVRDRLRSEVIVSRRELVRYIDYSIDILSGAITFAEPVASRDLALNPQFIVVGFETDQLSQGEWNGGLRAAWTSANGRLRLGGTAISDKGDDARTNVGAADLRLKIDGNTELRAEMALSTAAGDQNTAFSAQIEHHTGWVDLIGYAHQIDADFGTGQQNVADRGRRKIGADARVSLNDALSVVASSWFDDSLTDDGSRRALELRGVLRTEVMDGYVGISHLSDHRADGTDGTSTVLEGGATRRMLDNRLELSASTSLALKKSAAIDLPTRHRLSARYALTPDIRAVASYELAQGEKLDSRMLNAGLELSPFRGSRIVTTLGKQAIGPDASRNFAAFNLGQTLQLSDAVTIDALVDGSRTLSGGIALDQVATPAHPVTSGGQLSQDGTLGEDFTAFSLGLSWKADRWAARTRAEYRNGEFADRRGLSAAVIREMDEGKMVGGGFTWTRATAPTGATSEVAEASLTLALRPADSNLANLSKIEFRSDAIKGAVTGGISPVGQTALLVTGDAHSRRLIASTAFNWTPHNGGGQGATEIEGFAAMRHNLDRTPDLSLAGTSVLGGFDLRVGLGAHVQIGGRATVRHNLTDGTTHFAAGPELAVSPAENMVVSIGYNVIGFRDPDFAESRTTNRGVFASVKLKFDADSFGFLGLKR